MTAEEFVDVVVETPAGARNKYEVDTQVGMIRLDRRLPAAMVFPTDYGYVPGTLAPDGDPLDALVLVEESTFPGCLVEARLLGLFRMRDEKGADVKLLTVPAGEPRWAAASGVQDLPGDLLEAIAHFFDVYKDLDPGKMTETAGFGDKELALEELRRSRERFTARANPS